MPKLSLDWLSKGTKSDIKDAPRFDISLHKFPNNGVYSYEEFEGIALRLIKKLHPTVVIQIASSVWKAGSRDIRDVLKIAKLCNLSDLEEDIKKGKCLIMCFQFVICIIQPVLMPPNL
jgi:hypothetical protein